MPRIDTVVNRLPRLVPPPPPAPPAPAAAIGAIGLPHPSRPCRLGLLLRTLPRHHGLYHRRLQDPFVHRHPPLLRQRYPCAQERQFLHGKRHLRRQPERRLPPRPQDGPPSRG